MSERGSGVFNLTCFDLTAFPAQEIKSILNYRNVTCRVPAHNDRFSLEISANVKEIMIMIALISNSQTFSADS